MGAIDRLLDHARAHAPAPRVAEARPLRKVAIVACMDARIEPFSLFGVEVGDVHVIRNAGGVVTEDVIRSLAISQQFLGTTDVLLVHHTECGLIGLPGEALRTVAPDAPLLATLGFDDVEQDVRSSMHMLRASPYLPHLGEVRGVVYDVDTGDVTEVAG
ncbi:MAG: beta-class carbonic anhydrase [Acidimicrobiales bacterium]